MNQAHREVASRVRTIREQAKLSQRAFADMVGASRNQIAIVEYGWIPLHYGLADRICSRFNVCQRWLATGQDPPMPYIPVWPGLQLNSRALFADEYRKVLGAVIDQSPQAETMLKTPRGKEDSQEVLRHLPPAGAPDIERWLYHVRRDLRDVLAQLPSTKYSEVYSAIIKTASEFLESGDNTETTLDNVSGIKDGASVIPKSVPELMTEVKKLTASSGAKSWLARELRVSRQAVSNWLRSERPDMPSGEITLKLLGTLPRLRAKSAQRPSLRQKARVPAGDPPGKQNRPRRVDSTRGAHRPG